MMKRSKMSDLRQAYRRRHKDLYDKYRNFTNKELKNLAIYALGGKCARCGTEDYRVLQIDHINGGGSRETREIGVRCIYIKIISKKIYDNQYQVLCANCHVIRHFEVK